MFRIKGPSLIGNLKYYYRNILKAVIRKLPAFIF